MTVAGRTERDLIGERLIPSQARYGIHTVRALENFPRVGRRIADIPELVRSLGMVKLAALRANFELGVLDANAWQELERSCEELASGAPSLSESLPLPILQGGAGTSANMNVNEILANRALELMGLEYGDYARCHPNDVVNRSQSTNDVFPSAVRVALLIGNRAVRAALAGVASTLRERARSHRGMVTLGRTQLQDAVELRVDAELEAWAHACASAERGLEDATDGLVQVNLGGTAIGTGIAAPAGFGPVAVRHLRLISGLPLQSAGDLVAATTDPTPLLNFSSALRTAAVALAKVANDVRLLSSGPRAGLGEVSIPSVQAGSSLMPGKVNPVIAEFVNQAAFRVRGCDHTATLALDSGQLQLNAMLPSVAEALLEAQDLLVASSTVFAERCLSGLRFDEHRTRAHAQASLDEATWLAREIGYSNVGHDLAAATS